MYTLQKCMESKSTVELVIQREVIGTVYFSQRISERYTWHVIDDMWERVDHLYEQYIVGGMS